MKTLDKYIGIEPFTVPVDDSPQLRSLVEKARKLKDLSFSEKLEQVKKLALDSMVNAYEQMHVWKNKANEEEYDMIDVRAGTVDKPEASVQEDAKAKSKFFENIVYKGHPLSYALEQKAGCCRYQGALFFVLAYEAELGDKHFVQAAPVNKEFNTVFNEIIKDGKSHKISIFTESLEDKSLDYSRQNPDFFEQAFEKVPGLNLYSYHKTKDGLVLISNPEEHVKEITQNQQ